MSDSKFTPGPWKVLPAVSEGFRDIQGPSMEGHTATVWGTFNQTEDELEANARLIAAAPGMRNALTRISSLRCRPVREGDHEAAAQAMEELITEVRSIANEALRIADRKS